MLPAPHAERVAALLRWVGWVLQLLELKNLSITRLRQLCFGARTESARNLGDGPREPKTKTGAKRKGHGRRGHAQYNRRPPGARGSCHLAAGPAVPKLAGAASCAPSPSRR